MSDPKPTSISSPYRRLRPVTPTASLNDEDEANVTTSLLSDQEKRDGTLITIAESEVIDTDELNRISAAYTDRSSTVSLPSTRITSMASTWTGNSRDSRDSRTSSDSVALPPYPGRNSGANSEISDVDWEATCRTAGDYFRDIQRRIAEQARTPDYTDKATQ